MSKDGDPSTEELSSRELEVVSADLDDVDLPAQLGPYVLLHLLAGHLLGKAGHQNAATHGMHLMARDGALLDGHAQVKAELEQQFVEHVRFSATFEQVIPVVEQRGF